MKKIIQFSKKISDIKEIKKDFFTDNKKYLKTANRGFKLYVKEKKGLIVKIVKKLGKKFFGQIVLTTQFVKIVLT